MEPHEYANIFPMMSPIDINEMAESIKANGLYDSITTLEGKILDGRNRYQACSIAGVEPRFEEFTGTDPLDWVIAHNLTRRHLDINQRAMSGAMAAQFKLGGDRRSEDFKRPEGPLKTILTEEAAASKFDVSKRSIKRAKVILKGAIPEVIAAVQADEISLAAGEKIARMEDHEQRDTWAEGGIPALEAKVSQKGDSKPRPNAPAKLPKYVQSDALDIWLVAKSHLNRISDADTHFQESMNRAIDYCTQRLNAQSK